MHEPDVDLIVAVHDPRRRVERAVASALRGTQAKLRVTVVIHNTEQGPIAHRLGSLLEDHRVRLLQHSDGVPSPAGPFNAGLEAATARFTSVMGSDDELSPGAIDAWVGLADRLSASAVLARVRLAQGAYVSTPVARPCRGPLRDPVLDRLSYRSAPLGLVSRREFAELRFTEGVSVGEDVAYVSRVWFSGERLAYARRTPPYLVHADAAERASLSSRPVADELAFVPLLLDAKWFAELEERSRQSVIVKLMRVNLFGAVWNRRTCLKWSASDRDHLGAVGRRLVQDGGGIEQVFSHRDRQLLDAILDSSVPDSRLCELSRLRRKFWHPSALLTRDLSGMLHREAPLRFAAASTLQRL